MVHKVAGKKKRAKTCPPRSSASVVQTSRRPCKCCFLSSFPIGFYNMPYPFVCLSSLSSPCVYLFKMFECHLIQGSVLRKLMEAVVALVNNANIECSSSGEISFPQSI